MSDLLRRAVSGKKKTTSSAAKVKKNKSIINSNNKRMPSTASFTSTAAAVTDHQSTTPAVNHISNNNNNMAETRNPTHNSTATTNRSRFSSISSKATSSEDNLFSSSFESNTSSFLDANDDQRLDEATIQIFYDSTTDESPARSPPPTSSSSSSSARIPKRDMNKEKKRTSVTADNMQKVDIVVDEDLSASDLSDHMTIKLSLKGKHHLVAQIPSLNIQRDIQDDEEVLPLTLSPYGSSSYKNGPCVCEIDPSGTSSSSTSPTGKLCHRHNPSSHARLVHNERQNSSQLQSQKSDEGSGRTLRPSGQDPAAATTVKQSKSQETVREMPQVRIVLQKTPSSRYAFIERPQDFLCLNMIQFSSKGSESGMEKGGLAVTDVSSKVLLLQEMIRFGREALPLTVSGPLLYSGRLVMAEINLTGKHFQDFFLLKCKNAKGVNHESDAVFPSSQYDIYIPIQESDHCDDAVDDEGVHDDDSTSEETEERRRFRFALCRTGDAEVEPVQWFSCSSQEERTCWLTSMQMVKYGLKNMRQKAKSHAKHFPPDFDIVPPASYNELQQQSGYATMDSSDPASGIKQEDSSFRSNRSRSRDETVSFMMKKHSPEYEPWFYPDMGREEATTSLSKYSSVDGVFLVRASQRTLGTYVLSFIASGKVNHVTIQNVDADHGQVVVSLDWGVTKFYDLKQLIEFYQLNQGSLPTRLTHFLVHK